MARDGAHLEHMKYLSTQAKDDPHFYVHHEVGYNYRMTNVQAAIGVAQLEKLPEFIERKQRNYALYRELLCDMELGRMFDFRAGTSSNKWFYAFELSGGRISAREAIKALAREKIQTRAIWELIHEQTPYREDTAYQIEKAAAYQKRIVNLPCSTQLTQRDICRVAEQMKRLNESVLKAGSMEQENRSDR